MFASLAILGTLAFFARNAKLPHNRTFARIMLGMSIVSGTILHLMGTVPGTVN